MWRIAILLTILDISEAALSYTDVTISKSGYVGLVIAVHPDVPEDEGLINAIKETWTDASRNLYIATGNRAYFKEITILLPKTWNGSAYGPAKGNENYDRADVVVEPPDGSYGNEPYTEQYAECKQMGIRTHYTPAYLLDEKFVQNYGPRGKVVVHEWAHYRWGVFDETSTEFPFYWEDTEQATQNGPSPTTCPRGMSGEICNVKSGYTSTCDPCGISDIDTYTNSYPYYCVFFPYESQYNIDTSLMAYQYLDSVLKFCRDEVDADGDEYNIHNTDAPNDQNRLCAMKSVWSIIKESPDFQYWYPGDLVNINETRPKFEVVTTQKYQKFVLVLDDSGSMDSPCGSVTRSDCLKTAAYQFITVAAPNDSYVGIVVFGSSASVYDYLTLLDSQQSRDDLVNSIANLAGGSGGTCIGCGIQLGIQVLQGIGNTASGGQLIVITDGQENGLPSVSDTAGDVTQQGVVVNTVFISTDSNDDLKQLSEESGGQSYLATTQEDLQEIFSHVSITDSTDANTYQIYSSSFEINDNSSVSASVNLDATIGRNTIFTFTWSTGDSPPYIKIQSPSNCYYSNHFIIATMCHDAFASYTDSATFKTAQFIIPGIAEVGKWIYTVYGYVPVGLMTLLVTSSTPNEVIEPIIIQSGMGQTEIQNGAATVYAKVTQGSNPVLGAIVSATVTGQGGSSVLELYDNGAGSDIRVNDGVYSRYFTEFVGPGRYSVQVNVENGPSATQASTTKITSSASYSPGVSTVDGTLKVNPNGAISQEGTTNIGIQSNDLGNFSRVVPSGSFDYSGSVDVNDANSTDIYPPGKIIDTRLRQNDLTDIVKGILLEFTAPGDNYDSGTATGYEMRYSFGNFTNLVNNFDENALLNQSDLTTGNLSKPLSSGSTEQFTIVALDLPKDDDGNPVAYSYFGIAVKAFDEAGNYAEPSNVPVLSIFIEPISIVDPTESKIWWIILLVVLFVIIIVVFAGYRLQKRKKRPHGRNVGRQQQSPISTIYDNEHTFSHPPTTENRGPMTSPRENIYAYAQDVGLPPVPPKPAMYVNTQFSPSDLPRSNYDHGNTTVGRNFLPPRPESQANAPIRQTYQPPSTNSTQPNSYYAEMSQGNLDNEVRKRQQAAIADEFKTRFQNYA